MSPSSAKDSLVTWSDGPECGTSGARTETVFAVSAVESMARSCGWLRAMLQGLLLGERGQRQGRYPQGADGSALSAISQSIVRAFPPYVLDVLSDHCQSAAYDRPQSFGDAVAGLAGAVPPAIQNFGAPLGRPKSAYAFS